MDEETRTRKRLQELADMSFRTNTYCFTDFLAPADISLAYEVSAPGYATVWGGIDGAERAMVRFGSPEEFGYEMDFPIATLCIRAKNLKFAQPLTHRDYLGSLMSLGVERDVIGDILLPNRRVGIADKARSSEAIASAAWLFAAERMADYLCDSLVKIRHTDVICEKAGTLPPGIGYALERKSLTASSCRLDGIIAKVFHLSRNEAKEKFARQEVFLGGRTCANPSREPKPDDVISVRHEGKCIFRGISGETRKGNIVIEVDVYV